MITEHIVIIF